MDRQQWILTRKGNAITAVRFLVQETVSSFPVFMRPEPASFAGSFERNLLQILPLLSEQMGRITRCGSLRSGRDHLGG